MKTATKHEFTTEQLHELVFQAAGAATRPLLEDNPDYVFPAERVQEAVNFVLRSFELPTAGGGE